MTKADIKYYFNKLKQHAGHNIEIASYAYNESRNMLQATTEELDIQNISIECLDCNEVLIDFDKI